MQVLLTVNAEGHPLLSLSSQSRDEAKVTLTIKDDVPQLLLFSKEVLKEGVGNQLSFSVYRERGSASHLTNGRI